MRVIKPGKLGSSVSSKDTRTRRSQTSEKSWDIWDDFSQVKGNRKREYERGAGNRMVPKPSAKRDERGEGTDEAGAVHGQGEAAEQQEERYRPCNDYQSLEERLGYEFKDREILLRALTHRSALGLKERSDYERLEFLGDAVLDLSVAHLLSDLHPEAREGELSKMRAALVNTQALADIARKLELGPFIRLGRGEFSSGGAERPSILADVMEAVIGAVYRDSCYENALEMIERIFGGSLEQVTPFDPKTELQEALHAAGSEPPNYLLELVEGPEHAPTFVTVVVVDGEIVGRGRGPTKKAAQQAAAAEALGRMDYDAPEVELAEGQAVFISSLLLTEAKKVDENGAEGEGEGTEVSEAEEGEAETEETVSEGEEAEPG